MKKSGLLVVLFAWAFSGMQAATVYNYVRETEIGTSQGLSSQKYVVSTVIEQTVGTNGQSGYISISFTEVVNQSALGFGRSATSTHSVILEYGKIEEIVAQFKQCCEFIANNRNFSSKYYDRITGNAYITVYYTPKKGWGDVYLSISDSDLIFTLSDFKKLIAEIETGKGILDRALKTE